MRLKVDGFNCGLFWISTGLYRITTVQYVRLKVDGFNCGPFWISTGLYRITLLYNMWDQK